MPVALGINLLDYKVADSQLELKYALDKQWTKRGLRIADAVGNNMEVAPALYVVVNCCMQLLLLLENWE